MKPKTKKPPKSAGNNTIRQANNKLYYELQGVKKEKKKCLK